MFDVAQSRNLITVLRLFLLLGVIVLLGSQLPPAVFAAPEQRGLIAYTAPDGKSIRVIAANGSQDRLLWQDPGNIDFSTVSGLDWSPDGAQLAFGSNHEILCSNYQSDIFVINADGSNERRLTNPPACPELANFEQGSVTVRVENQMYAVSLFTLYIEGADQAFDVTIQPGYYADITLGKVADFGAEVPQNITVMSGNRVWIDPSITVDVQAGTGVTVDGTFILSTETDFEYFGATYPRWHPNGQRLGFMLGYAIPAEISSNVQLGAEAQTIFPPEAGITGGRMAWSPDGSQLLLADGNRIYSATPGGNETQLLVEGGSTHMIYGLDWLPDGSGFVFTLSGGDIFEEYANLYHYDFGSGQSTPVTHFQDEFAAFPSVSPDGQSVVYMRAPGLEAGANLWIVSLDGSQNTDLGVAGGFPDWGSTVDPAATATPTATPTPSSVAPTATPTPTSAAPTATPTPQASQTPQPVSTPDVFIYLPLVLQ